jgi:Fe-S-cluster-containing hydrogenase component 2
MKDKRLYVVEDLCSGCRMCEMVCSFLRIRAYNSRKSKVRIVKVEWEGVNIPIADCDGIDCAKLSPLGVPRCVEACPTGALMFAEAGEAAERRRLLATQRIMQPIFKVIAPWKWPFPWRPWREVAHEEVG